MRFVLSLIALLALAAPVTAHPPIVLNSGAAQGLEDELRDFRRRMAIAINAKDAATLRAMYAAAFQHIQASARIDGRDAHIAAALAGDAMIETAETADLTIRIYAGGWAAIASGTSPIRFAADGKTDTVVWTQMFAREDTRWVLVASQATRRTAVKTP